MTTEPPLRLAMFGGGPGSFIGPVHAMAAGLDGRWRIVAGAFSRDPARNAQAAARYGIAPDRAYDDWRALAAAEAARPDGAQAVAIVTPNHLHAPMARSALDAGLAVICDKPLTATLAEALALADAAARSGRPVAVTHTYAGYPMIRHLRAEIAAGRIGAVRKVVATYHQGWLAQAVEDEGNLQAAWRTDPALAGAGALADVGTHAFHLCEHVTGVQVDALFADVRTVVRGRGVDDDAAALLRFAGGAAGVLSISQVAAGERNGLSVKVNGDQGSMHWSHEAPDRLIHLTADGDEQVMHAGAAAGRGRLPIGHPEGFIEAFATLYREFADMMAGGPRPPDLPGIEAGVRGMRFIDAALRSSREARWARLEQGA